MNAPSNYSTARPAGVDTAADAAPKAGLRRVVWGAMAGSIIEWFEFSVYGYLAAVMGKVFFSTSSPSVQIVASFATFAVAFLARPFGGVICGVLGDRYGRKSVLNATLFVMAAATFCIGLLPSYSSIGVLAPVLLVVLRLLQGLSAGGEVSAAAIYVAERCEDRNRTLMTAWVEVGAMAGFLAGALASYLLHIGFDDATLTSWGWRLPFYLAAPLALIGLYIRRRLEESQAFVDAQRDGRIEAVSVVKQIARLGAYRKAMLQAAGMVIVTNITLFTVLSYIPTYLNRNLHLSGSKALAMSLLPMVVLVLLIPVFAVLADRIGRKKVMIAGSIAVLVLAIPAFDLLRSSDIVTQVGVLIVLNICLAALTSCIFAQVPSLFPIKVRFMAMSISYNVTIAIFAGTAPMIDAWLIERTGNPNMPAYYMIFGCVVGLVALLSSKDHTGRPLEER
ncbi:Proline/betaine transporter [Paraburkholderia domus]|uniref:MFS transporter n=1 Tax=Paraburkholderia domus TaxID=2793075 RepID=UPI001911EFAB|nr:MFS transporter [Paraburkholderia domus]MBK5091412.1 MFS transporter [Burkholderia sp. R-69927]CAE6935910.1 Proline/betaine transporter [Paraburkholderia domus]